MNTPVISLCIKRLLDGVNKANYKMVKAAVAEHRSVALGDKEGKVIHSIGHRSTKRVRGKA